MLALSLTALFLTASLVMLEAVIARQEPIAAAVNVSDRQFMLPQRIVL